MYFGKRYTQKPDRGFSSGTRKQILLLLGALVATGLIGFQFLGNVPRRVEAPAEDMPSPRPGFGPQIPTVAPDLVGGLPPAPEPKPPAEFVERPDILARGSEADRSGTFDQKLIAYLLQKVRTREPGEIDGQTPRLSLERKDDVVWQALIDRPDEHRGRLVEIKGEILSPEPGIWPLDLRGLDFPNPSGIDRAYQSYVMGVDSKYYMVVTARKERELSHRDGVRLRGYFCQLYTYSILFRGETRRATIPLLVGADYGLLDRPTTGQAWAGDYLPLLVALGIIAFLGVMLFQGRSVEQYEARRREGRQKGHVRGGGAGAAGEGGGPP